MFGYYHTFLAPLEDAMWPKGRAAPRAGGAFAAMKIKAEDVPAWATTHDSAAVSKLERAVRLLQELGEAEPELPGHKPRILGHARRQIPSSVGTMTSPRVSCVY